MNRIWERRLSPFMDIAKTAWVNRDNLGYAWRILTGGVCDGCALGTDGLRDWTMKGIHLCWIRLNLLRLNTMSPLDPALLADAGPLKERSEADLRKMGRLPVPMIRRKRETGFRPVGWEEALKLAAGRIRQSVPHRVAFYLVSRGTANETYYAAQKAARFLGSNHIDNSARICHAPSTTALRQAIGYAATTCSYRDMIGSDLLVFIGSDAANNQPVLMKYLHMAKKEGTRIAMINPFREPGMERYWVPSAIDSALWGTQIADAFFPIRVGGDIAFINGVLKHLIYHGWADRDFIDRHTEGWQALKDALDRQPFDDLERCSGASRSQMLDFARMYAKARTSVLVWSMGVTMHRHGTDNVRAIANLGLARGMVGRPHTGLMPIRGHSGVQGGAEMGAVPNAFPGEAPVGEESARRFSEVWGFTPPTSRGYYVSEMIDAAWREELDVFYCSGGNLLGVLPDGGYVRKALERIPLRIHQDIVLNPQMLVEPEDTVLLLPATTRYEMAGGCTETTTERRVIFSPEIPGPRVPEARDEWQVLCDIARRVKPDASSEIDFTTTRQIREEIARAIPSYAGIERLARQGDQFQWGGPRLGEEGRFATENGKARFMPVAPPQFAAPEGAFLLTTRRGKQFNSMTFAAKDTQTGSSREDVMLSQEDMARLNLRDGSPVLVRSRTGEFRGQARPGPLFPGSVMMYWPEANALIGRASLDPECGIPAYRDEWVEVILPEDNREGSRAKDHAAERVL
ncbi:MAG: FdhF/YdeP family oxidoreductase [Armatimonadetes bacterium]|nr:FdhF/YdeP family oxidoreductase [Armatimonadota bacterium]